MKNRPRRIGQATKASYYIHELKCLKIFSVASVTRDRAVLPSWTVRVIPDERQMARNRLSKRSMKGRIIVDTRKKANKETTKRQSVVRPKKK